MTIADTRKAFARSASAAAQALLDIYQVWERNGNHVYYSKANYLEEQDDSWDLTTEQALAAMYGGHGMASPDVVSRAYDIKPPKSILGTSTKMSKTDSALPVLTRVSYLAPANMLPRTLGIIGEATACPMAKLAGCAAPCLGADDGSGHLAMPNGSARMAMLGRTMLLLGDPVGFAHLLLLELRSLRAAAAKKGALPAVRLDGTSDLGMAQMIESVLQDMGIVRFDYSKTGRAFRDIYHTTFSAWNDPTGIKAATKMIRRGGRVSIVVGTRDIARAMATGRALRKRLGWEAATVVDGDRAEPVDACARPEIRVLTLKATAKESFDRSKASRLVFPVECAGCDPTREEPCHACAIAAAR